MVHTLFTHCVQCNYQFRESISMCIKSTLGVSCALRSFTHHNGATVIPDWPDWLDPRPVIQVCTAMSVAWNLRLSCVCDRRLPQFCVMSASNWYIRKVLCPFNAMKPLSRGVGATSRQGQYRPAYLRAHIVSFSRDIRSISRNRVTKVCSGKSFHWMFKWWLHPLCPEKFQHQP